MERERERERESKQKEKKMQPSGAKEPIFSFPVDEDLWTLFSSRAEKRDAASVAVVDVTSSPPPPVFGVKKEPEVMNVEIVRTSSPNSADQFGVIKGRQSAKRVLSSLQEQSKKTKVAEETPSALISSGVWVIASHTPGCKAYVFTGKPINKELHGVFVNAVDETNFDGSIYKAFSPNAARILGQGGSGLALLVTDRTDPSPSTWNLVVLKIEVKPKINPSNPLEATMKGEFREIVLAKLLNKIFYDSRITPCVTKTYAAFQCDSLPPDTGAWNKVTSKIWPPQTSNVRRVVRGDKDLQYLYTEQEWADVGTVNDLLEGRPGDISLLLIMENLEQKRKFMLSVLIQGFYTLEAFRRSGFIHGDINLRNIALATVKGPPHLFFINDTGDESSRIRAFAPYTTGDLGDPDRYMLKFIDYGTSRFSDPDMEKSVEARGNDYSKRLPGSGLRWSATPFYITPPEAFMREIDRSAQPTGGTRQARTKTSDPVPAPIKPDLWLSSNSDVWQFALAMISLALGRHPLVDATYNYRYVPPDEFTKSVKEYVTTRSFNFINILSIWGTDMISLHLWNVSQIIGVPGTDPVTGKLDLEASKKLKETYPILYAFDTISEADQRLLKGWLRSNSAVSSTFGPEITEFLLLSLGWSPNLRPLPGEIMSVKHGEWYDAFRRFFNRAKEAFPSLGDPYNVAIRTYDDFARVSKGRTDVNVWSLVTTSISYHVNVSQSLQRALFSSGTSRFTKLEKSIHEQLEQHLDIDYEGYDDDDDDDYESIFNQHTENRISESEDVSKVTSNTWERWL